MNLSDLTEDDLKRLAEAQKAHPEISPDELLRQYQEARPQLVGTASAGPLGASATIETQPGQTEPPTDEPGVWMQPDPNSPASMLLSPLANLIPGLAEQIKSIIPGTEASQRAGEGILNLLASIVPGTPQSMVAGRAIAGLPAEIGKRLKGPTLMNPEQVTEDLRNLSVWIAKHPADALGLISMIPGAGAIDPLVMAGRGASVAGRLVTKAGKPVLRELSGVSPGSFDVMVEAGRARRLGTPEEATFEAARTGKLERNELMRQIDEAAKGVSEAKSQKLMEDLQGRVIREVQAGGRQDRAATVFAQAIDPQFGPESVLNTVKPALGNLEATAANTYMQKMAQVPNVEVGWGNIRQKFLKMLDKEGMTVQRPEMANPELDAVLSNLGIGLEDIEKLPENKAKQALRELQETGEQAGFPTGGKVIAKESRYQLTPEDQAKWQLLYDTLANKQVGDLTSVDRFKQAVWELREKIPNKKEAFAGRLEQLYGDVRGELSSKAGQPFDEAQAAWRDWKEIQRAARDILKVDATNPETTITKLRGAGIEDNQIRSKVLSAIQQGTQTPLDDLIKSLEVQRDLKGMFQGQSVQRLPWDSPLTPEQGDIVNKFAKSLLPQDEYESLVREFGKDSFGQKLLNRIHGIAQSERLTNAPSIAINEPTGLRKLANVFLNPTEEAVHNAVIEAVLKDEPYLRQKIAGQEFNPLFSGNYLARRVGSGVVLGLSAFWQPWVLPVLPLLSPRLTGWAGTRAIYRTEQLKNLFKYVPEHSLVRAGALSRVMQEMRPESPIKEKEKK